jgi:mannose-1-phosphate guanylyltransferase
MRYGMIMAGGAGTRLWPMSRKRRPKQLLPLIGGRSLLEIAADRLNGIIEPERRLICTGEAFRELIRKSLPQFTDEQILGEPVGRDTVNAVAFTAAVLAKRDGDAVFAVLTADHLIEPQEEFEAKLRTGFELVEANPKRLVTFSITPTHATSGFGYVERGEAITGFSDAYRAKRFIEKPERKVAEQFIATGNFGWNSGMFIFHARTILDALRRFKPETHEGVMSIQAAWEAPDQQRVLEQVYPTLPKISIDYALMQPASDDAELEVCTVQMDVTWMDVGSWPSYGETLAPDMAGNRTNARTMHLDSRNVLAVSDDPAHTIATIGCDHLIIVRTRDVTLVCPASEAQRVKDIAGMVDESLR